MLQVIGERILVAVPVERWIVTTMSWRHLVWQNIPNFDSQLHTRVELNTRGDGDGWTAQLHPVYQTCSGVRLLGGGSRLSGRPSRCSCTPEISTARSYLPPGGD